MDADVLERFRACVSDPNADEIRLASLVARVLDPALSSDAIEADLQGLARRCPAALPPWQFLAGQGFEGNSRDYSALDNSNLARVLDTRRGIPITHTAPAWRK